MKHLQFLHCTIKLEKGVDFCFGRNVEQQRRVSTFSDQRDLRFTAFDENNLTTGDHWHQVVSDEPLFVRSFRHVGHVDHHQFDFCDSEADGTGERCIQFHDPKGKAVSRFDELAENEAVPVYITASTHRRSREGNDRIAVPFARRRRLRCIRFGGVFCGMDYCPILLSMRDRITARTCDCAICGLRIV